WPQLRRDRRRPGGGGRLRRRAARPRRARLPPLVGGDDPLTPTTCADSGTLRAHLDPPDAELERHLDTCEDCAGLLRAVAADTGTTARALRLLDHDADRAAEDVDVEAALAAAAARRAPAAAAAPVER